MAQYEGSVARSPGRTLFTWYIALCLGGGMILHMPICQNPSAAPISLIDGVFTATSACCVTGLAVRSTANDFSLIGQIVILVWIQVGGIGIMTLTTFMMLTVGGQETLRQRNAMAATIGSKHGEDLRGILWRVALITLGAELVGAGLLATRYAFDMPLASAAWLGLFHSIAAFCNAGFALHDLNLIPDQGDLTVNLTVCGLIILGGIGFPVILDVQRKMRQPRGRRWEKMELHTKLVLLGTAGLLVTGTLLIFVLEWDYSLAGMPFGRQLLVSFFQSTTTRTAGFNTIDMTKLTDATLFVMILWMMIGAAPCSTGGGFKVSTAMVLLAQVWARFRGKQKVTCFRRTLSPDLLTQALTSVLLFTSVAALGLLLLLVVEEAWHPGAMPKDFFLDALFEVVSAQATVGLSTGLTPKLSELGKLVITLLMFIGRLGPITVAVVLSRDFRPQPLEYPKEEVLLG